MFLKSVETVFLMIILISIGWILAHIGWTSNEVKGFLNKVVVKICVPALIITNFFETLPQDMLPSSIKYISVSFLSMGFLYIIAILLAKIIKIKSTRYGSFISMCVVSNSMFFGLPISLGLFGEQSIPFVIFYYMSNTIFFWGVCVPLIMKGGGVVFEGKLKTLKNILNIPLITIIISGILLSINLTPPSLVLKTARYFSNLVTPLASLVVGKIIYDINLKNYKLNKSILLIIFMRFVIAPISIFSLSRFFSLSILTSQVFTVQAAMPVMMQTTIVSEIYGEDSEYVATSFFVTTVLSLLFIPLYMLVMDKILF